MLEPEAARLVGKVILADTTFSGEKKNARREGRGPGKRPVYPLLTRFLAPEDAAEWTFAVPEAGRYSVTIDYSMPGKSEGNDPPRYALAVAGDPFSFAPDFTRSQSGFQLVDVGTAHLPAGQVTLTLRPENKPTGRAVLHVRGIRLFPAD